jgi:predicted dithiol-disulfide oxidoreductase (DUF899 family)
MEKPLHSVRFPGETPEYRTARDRLLKAELDLRKQVEEVTALPRRLPLGARLLDVTPEGRGTDWSPKLSYDTT